MVLAQSHGFKSVLLRPFQSAQLLFALALAALLLIGITQVERDYDKPHPKEAEKVVLKK